MNEQEMQFADPEWKPTAGNSSQDEGSGARNSPLQVGKNQTSYNHQVAKDFLSYEEGYQGNQRRLPPIPYIAPVSAQQMQSRSALAPRRRSRWWLWVIIVVVAIYLLGGFPSFQSHNPSFSPIGMHSPYSYTRSYSLDGISQIRIENTSGTIDVQIDDSGKNSLTVNSTDNNMSLSSGLGLLDLSLHGDTTITLPSYVAATLDLSTTTGEITVSGYQGQLSAHTGDDTITLSNCQISGQSTLNTGSGDINVNYSNISGTTSITSDSGDLTFDQTDLSGGNVTVSAGEDGDVTFNGTLSQQGSYHFSTQNGDLDLALPTGISLDVHVNKGADGSYSNTLPTGAANGPTPPISVDVKTDGGSITIHQQ